ncbi:hypothetical protein MA16_Dca006830 [Dendrobium catenatum]|uniref:Uncharacterized protein n=1 Tax=Dendrobium catenatum TaxID=906689 RepID=A0A2I0VSW4_9ASPA|nr:hypothetical protein MA16_Dca006830 [Dendrobium catenatum]
MIVDSAGDCSKDDRIYSSEELKGTMADEKCLHGQDVIIEVEEQQQYSSSTSTSVVGPLVIKDVSELSPKVIRHVEGKGKVIVEMVDMVTPNSLKSYGIPSDINASTSAMKIFVVSNNINRKGCLRTQVNPKGLSANSSITYHVTDFKLHKEINTHEVEQLEQVIIVSKSAELAAGKNLMVEVPFVHKLNNMFYVLQNVNDEGHAKSYEKNTLVDREEGELEVDGKIVKKLDIQNDVVNKCENDICVNDMPKCKLSKELRSLGPIKTKARGTLGDGGSEKLVRTVADDLKTKGVEEDLNIVNKIITPDQGMVPKIEVLLRSKNKFEALNSVLEEGEIGEIESTQNNCINKEGYGGFDNVVNLDAAYGKMDTNEGNSSTTKKKGTEMTPTEPMDAPQFISTPLVDIISSHSPLCENSLVGTEKDPLLVGLNTSFNVPQDQGVVLLNISSTGYEKIMDHALHNKSMKETNVDDQLVVIEAIGVLRLSWWNLSVVVLDGSPGRIEWLVDSPNEASTNERILSSISPQDQTVIWNQLKIGNYTTSVDPPSNFSFLSSFEVFPFPSLLLLALFLHGSVEFCTSTSSSLFKFSPSMTFPSGWSGSYDIFLLEAATGARLL